MGTRKKQGEVVFTRYSPYMAVDVPIFDANGRRLKGPRVISLCRCGKSSMKPYCDGTHAKIGFSGAREEEDARGVKSYRGKQIVIHDNRYLCAHDGACIRLLPAVFSLSTRPWINPDGASQAKIVSVIRKCPSGALSYSLKARRGGQGAGAAERVAVEAGGPLHCQGAVSIKDDQDSAKLLRGSDHCTLCRCGASRHKPLCDGSHGKVDFKD